MKTKTFLTFILIAFLIFLSFVDTNISSAGSFFAQSTTVESLKNNYRLAQENEYKKLRILVVPGHDKENWGTQYNGTKEEELNVELAEYLTKLLRKESEFEVYLLRNKEGYDQLFLKYLENNENMITQFQQEHKNEMLQLIQSGQIDSIKGVEHVSAPSDVATMLYGANKWANDLDTDIVIHIHFNDYPRRYSDWAGKYSGFSIYIPEKQYSNSEASFSVAESVKNSLNKFFATSDYEKEGAGTGIVEDQELIAIGAYNTLNSASLLVEYGYIYESQFTNSNTREFVLRELAFQTYNGVKEYFEGENRFTAYVLPYQWSRNLKKGMKHDKDIFALQSFMATKGFYPPSGSNLNDCPITGNFGNCTLKAVQQYQLANDIYPPYGYVGPITRSHLHEAQ